VLPRLRRLSGTRITQLSRFSGQECTTDATSASGLYSVSQPNNWGLVQGGKGGEYGKYDEKD